VVAGADGEIWKDSVNGSRLTLNGRIAEQMAPVLPGFLFNPTDARFIGTPEDYIILDGLTGVCMRRTKRSGFFHGCIKMKQQPHTDERG